MTALSKACKHGGCAACMYASNLCSCPHHVDGAYRTTEPDQSPAPVVTEPAPEHEGTVQGLIAQAAGQAKTIEALARLVWEGTQRCVYCPRGYCERCRSALDLLDSLGFGDRMREWAA